MHREYRARCVRYWILCVVSVNKVIYVIRQFFSGIIKSSLLLDNNVLFLASLASTEAIAELMVSYKGGKMSVRLLCPRSSKSGEWHIGFSLSFVRCSSLYLFFFKSFPFLFHSVGWKVYKHS